MQPLLPSSVLLNHEQQGSISAARMDCESRGLLVKAGFSNLPYELGFLNLFFEVVEGGGAVH